MYNPFYTRTSGIWKSLFILVLFLFCVPLIIAFVFMRLFKYFSQKAAERQSLEEEMDFPISEVS
jgi:hypothetical protein